MIAAISKLKQTVMLMTKIRAFGLNRLVDRSSAALLGFFYKEKNNNTTTVSYN